MRRETCRSVARSSAALTPRAATSLRAASSATCMMGVEMLLLALMISLRRGTPSVTFMLATPAKWNVFRVICVPGSPRLCVAHGRGLALRAQQARSTLVQLC